MADAHHLMLKLAFEGEAFPSGDVPITLVASKLQALQTLVFHAAATLDAHRQVRRGPWVNRYRPHAELRFAGAHHSTLEIAAELPSPPPWSDDPDFGANAVDLMFDFLASVTSSRVSPGKSLEKFELGNEDALYLLRASENLCPGFGDDYTLVIRNSSDVHHPVILTRETRDVIKKGVVAYETTFPSAKDATIVGTLTKIHVDVAPQLISVRVPPGREVPCYYPDNLRDQVANLMAGSVVEVSGWATLEGEDKIRQIDVVSDVASVSMEPLRLAYFEYQGKRYRLRQPIDLAVEYTEEAWIYSNPDINLWGVGLRRDDAIRDLHENFDYIWNEFATEKDDVLDDAAQTIKRKLLALVKPLSEE